MRRVVLGILCASPALAGEYDCPPTLETRQQGEAPAGWQTFVDAANDPPHRLEGVTFYDGHPTETASLKYSRLEGQTATWDFSAKAVGGAYWLACRYRGTKVQLIRELPADVRVCAVTYAKDAVAGIDCRTKSKSRHTHPPVHVRWRSP